MERQEKIWLGGLIVVLLIFTAITLSSLVPWQNWLIWSPPEPAEPDERVNVEMGNYNIHLPSQVIEVKANKFVEFSATSKDVTYGFGVFRADGTMVFQMQVLPGYTNRMTWKFDKPGFYDVRSTEYSGPRHSEMFLKNAIRVSE